MKLFLISRLDNVGYDEFDSGVVCAIDEMDARTIHPGGELYQKSESDHTWVEPGALKVKEIGIAAPDMARGVVLGSFNAG